MLATTQDTGAVVFTKERDGDSKAKVACPTYMRVKMLINIPRLPNCEIYASSISVRVHTTTVWRSDPILRIGCRGMCTKAAP